MDVFSLLVAMNGINERVTEETNKRMNDVTGPYKDSTLYRHAEQQEHLNPHDEKLKKNTQH